MSPLRWKVEAYLRESGVPPTRFGTEAMGDPRFVFDLRQGRQLRPETSARLLAWLEQAEQKGTARCDG